VGIEQVINRLPSRSAFLLRHAANLTGAGSMTVGIFGRFVEIRHGGVIQ
jgi:hypothetical protein